MALTVHVDEEVIQGTLSSSFIHASIGETIVNELGDMEVARQVFRRSEELAHGFDDLECLAGTIRCSLKDRIWSKRLRAEAKTLKQK